MKAPILFLVLAGSLMLAAKPARADDPAVPGEGYPASRYETLWTKSPFAVATAEAAQESPDYMLVGFAQFEGVSYASLIERQNQEHFLVSTDKPNRGITLTSITLGHDGMDTTAVVQKDGQPITLKLEQAPVTSTPAAPAVPGAPTAAAIPVPGNATPLLPMPGAGGPSPTTPSTRPLIRIHRPQIHLPPRPDEQPQPVQVHPAPPAPQ